MQNETIKNKILVFRTIGEGIMKHLKLIFLLIIGVIFVSACSAPNDAVMVYTTPEPLTSYVSIKEDKVIAWEYEEYNDALEIGSLTFTAHDGMHRGYRGVLTLSDELIKDNELEADEEIEIMLDCDKIDISKYSAHWYYCENLYYVFSLNFGIDGWGIDDLYYDGNNKIMFVISERDY